MRRKAQEDAEAEKADESLKAIVREQLAEIEAEAEAEAEKSREGDLEIHTVEPVIEKVEEPVIEKVKEPVKKVAREPVKKVAREPVERRKLNLMPPFSPFERRGQK